MHNSPLVSVIIPAYNCRQWIPETLDSLFTQDYPHTEIIVVNDGSKDGTLDLIRGYGNRIVVIDQANTGAPGARNAGISAAQGDLIAFCDADDIWGPNKVREQVTYLHRHPEVGMIFCDWHVWEPDSTGNFAVPAGFGRDPDPQAIDTTQSGWVYHKLLLDSICLTSTVMLRKDIVSQVGFFDVDLWNGDDYDFWLRASRITEIHKLRAKLVLYRILPNSVGRTPTRVHYEYNIVRQAIARWGDSGPTGARNAPGALPARFRQLKLDFGYLHLHGGDPAVASRCFWYCVARRPLKTRTWAYLLLSLWKRATQTAAQAAGQLRGRLDR